METYINRQKAFSAFSIEELKELLKGHYELLGNIDSYKYEKTVDSLIHSIKKELQSRGIYVKEKIKPIFIKIK